LDVFRKQVYIAKTTGLLIVAATLFCVLFGQGTHLHDLDIHISSHLDVHVHLHAHESHDEPMQADQNEEENNHRHEVSTASDIIGTLTSSFQVRPVIVSYVVPFSVDLGPVNTINPVLQQSPTLFDLPPPRAVPNRYHLTSFSRRGPPIS